MILKKGVVGVGIVLGWASIPFFGFLSPRTTEALGFREALVLADNTGCAKIIVEGDCSQVIQALTHGGYIAI